MKLKVLPYKSYSNSAKELVRSLSPIAIMKKQSTPVYGRKKIVLNWGNSNPMFSLDRVTILNKPDAVKVASNKLTAFIKMKEGGIKIPEFTTDIEQAKEWINNNRIVLCRKLLRSNSGKGIVIAKTVDDLVAAPLYVKYIRKEKEYRVHVFNGTVIDVVEKRRRRGYQESSVYNKYIRSYEQGWVFVREGITVTEDLNLAAINAVQTLGLDFGAVDIVIDKDNNPVVLEVNTAPGLQGTTLQSYKNAVKEWFNEQV
jgi:glutathione synthase/RimK-type ligase-like ATP-grasp enzyme